MGNSLSRNDKFLQDLMLILKKYIPNIDLQNPIIKYQIDKLNTNIYDISDLIIPLKSIFQINNCKNKFIECLKDIYSLHLKYSERLHRASKRIVIDLSAALSIPQIESFIICLFLLVNDFAIMRFTNFIEDNYEEILKRMFLKRILNILESFQISLNT